MTTLRQGRHGKRRLASLSAWLALTVSVGAALAQDTVLSYEGRVLWVSMQTLVLGLDNAPAVAFDLRRISQREIMNLSHNDYVLVTGVIMRPGHQVEAISIQRISSWFPQQAP